MKVLSLFDGISCGRVALERAGITVSRYVAFENDKYAIAVSKKNYPDIEHRGEITADTDFSEFEGFDMVIGGSPCQSFSRSGDNSGFLGKSGLFFEYLRALHQVHPKYFLFENVIMKKTWQNTITESLGVSPFMIDSAMFSAQKRQRLYWTNIIFEKEIKDRTILLSDIFMGGERIALNNHPVIIKRDGGAFYIRNATKQGYFIAHDGDAVNLEMPKSSTRRGRVSHCKTNTLNTSCNYGYINNGNLVELNITEYERLQTLADGHTTGISLSQRKKVIGNGWTVDVIAHIFNHLKLQTT